jgi:hypothetical protein
MEIDFSDYLEGTVFEHELLKALQSFTSKHMNDALNNTQIDYQSYGDEFEVRLKKVIKFHCKLYTVFKDLDFTFYFLDKPRNLILEHYPKLETQESYFTYHFENYYIRLASIGDIIGRLGVLIYRLELDLKKTSAYTFKDKARKEGFEEISLITENIISKIKTLRENRHSKLHNGEADIRFSKGIVIWEDINPDIIGKVPEILINHTDKEISDKLIVLRGSTLEIIDLIKQFLEKSISELKKIINKTAKVV